MRKLTRIKDLLKQTHQAAPAREVLLREIASWTDRTRRAYLALSRKEPEADKAVNALWSEDPYLLALLDLGEGDEDPKQPRGVLTFLVLGAASEPLSNDTAYLLALCWQEWAAAKQAELERRRAGDERGQAEAAREAKDAWVEASGRAAHYAEEYPLTAATLHGRLKKVLAEWHGPHHRLDAAMGLWEYLFRDLRRSATAQLFQATALRGEGRAAEADATLDRLAKDLAALRANAELKAALKECNELTRKFQVGGAEVRAHLAELESELGERGSLYWLEYSARLRRQKKD